MMTGRNEVRGGRRAKVLIKALGAPRPDYLPTSAIRVRFSVVVMVAAFCGF
jgi:hypothetical protein